MGLDSNLSPEAINLRNKTALMMDSVVEKLEPYYESATFPHWIIDDLRKTGINGLTIKGYGSPGLSTVEMGAVIYEIAKRDCGIASFMIVHNGIGMAVINSLGNDE